MLAGLFAAMTCIGAKLGELFNKFKPLTAYSIDVAGAIAGSIAFALVSFFGFHPWALIIPAVIPLCYFMLRDKVNLALGLIPLIRAVITMTWTVDPPDHRNLLVSVSAVDLTTLQNYLSAELSDVKKAALWTSTRSGKTKSGSERS